MRYQQIHVLRKSCPQEFPYLYMALSCPAPRWAMGKSCLQCRVAQFWCLD